MADAWPGRQFYAAILTNHTIKIVFHVPVHDSQMERLLQ
jgi:hypothetical protein